MTPLTEEDWELARHRVASMPSNIALSIGSLGSLNKEEILRHLEKRDDAGRKIVALQLAYLKFFKNEMEKIADA